MRLAATNTSSDESSSSEEYEDTEDAVEVFAPIKGYNFEPRRRLLKNSMTKWNNFATHTGADFAQSKLSIFVPLFLFHQETRSQGVGIGLMSHFSLA